MGYSTSKTGKMKHSEIKVGETYYEKGMEDHYRLIALSVGDEVVNMGWNTYAKTVKFRREFYSKGIEPQLINVVFSEPKFVNERLYK